jgi:hypothetical protein
MIQLQEDLIALIRSLGILIIRKICITICTLMRIQLIVMIPMGKRKNY